MLYVEDDELIGRFVGEALKLHDVDVHVVTTAADGMAALADDAASYLMVLSDQSLPDRPGLELLRDIRARYAALPLVLTTGFVDADLEAALVDFDGLLPKPFGISDVVALVTGFAAESGAA